MWPESTAIPPALLATSMKRGSTLLPSRLARPILRSTP
jgi:hypothetical protein